MLSSATPGKVADDSRGTNSVLVSELLNNLNAQAGAETAFNKTRVAISRASEGEQVPSVSSSLLEDIAAPAAGGRLVCARIGPRIRFEIHSVLCGENPSPSTLPARGGVPLALLETRITWRRLKTIAA